MTLTLNGDSTDFPDEATISDVLKHFGREDAGVAVAVNFDVVPRHEFPQRVLHDGDRVDIVTAVGGG
ncbi:MAG: sulfur carrier protein ThiS [Deltaproteobacteria bacterium]|nr:sulfur carrier protein ThiS [Deltaproteobacteria bacterium]